jgi:hypothetical protein
VARATHGDQARQDTDARILEQAPRERRGQGMRAFPVEWQAERAAFTGEELAEAVDEQGVEQPAGGGLVVGLRAGRWDYRRKPLVWEMKLLTSDVATLGSLEQPSYGDG